MSWKTMLIGLAVAAGLGAQSYAEAKTELIVHYASPWQVALHKPIAEQYMKRNPEVTVTLRPPSQNYEDGAQTVIRQSLASQLPDITFAGLTRVRTLADRDIPVDLSPYLAGEPNVEELGYEPAILSIGRIQGTLYAVPFAISTPIAFYNADLVDQAGGDPQNFPSDWDSILALANRIGNLGPEVDGMWHRIGPDDWMVQALIYSTGADLMTTNEEDIAFDNEAGLFAANMTARFAKEGGRRPISETAARQQFVAGTLGMFFGTTNLVKRFEEQVGDKFRIGTATYPLHNPKTGGLPVGGNAAVIVSQDPEKQKLAWDYVKFATGPVGQKIVVMNSGYMPANRRALEKKFLGEFYEENPNWKTSTNQLRVARPWYAWPGANGVKITRVLGDGFERIAQGAPAEPTFAQTAAEIRRLLP